MPSRAAAYLPCLIALLLYVTPLSEPLDGATSRPNIVVIMVDDLDTAALDVLLANGRMPNFQRWIIERGASFRFTESFVTRSICCPSRATFFTGQYAHNHKVLTNVIPLGGVTAFRDTSTIATWLKAAGYRTGLIGKYLNGFGTDVPWTYIPPGWDSFQAIPDFLSSRMYHYSVVDNGTLVNYGSGSSEFQTDVLARRGADFITSSSQPFFLYMAVSQPHIAVNPQYSACAPPGSEWEFTPIAEGQWNWQYAPFPAPRYQGVIFGDTRRYRLPMPPSFNEADVSDKPSWFQHAPLTAQQIDCTQKHYWRRLESMLAVDDLIAQIQLALQNRQIANTVIVFTSDNGFLLGHHRMAHKGFAFEESIRVPLYIAFTGTTGPQTISHVVLNNDLAPTIAAFAGVTPGLTVDGRSLLPLLANPGAVPSRRRFLIEHWSERPTAHSLDYFAVRTRSPASRLYVHYPTAPGSVNRELYHLDTDPYQLKNLQDQPAQAAEMSQLQAWVNRFRTCAGASCSALEDAVTLPVSAAQ